MIVRAGSNLGIGSLLADSNIFNRLAEADSDEVGRKYVGQVFERYVFSTGFRQSDGDDTPLRLASLVMISEREVFS